MFRSWASNPSINPRRIASSAIALLALAAPAPAQPGGTIGPIGQPGVPNTMPEAIKGLDVVERLGQKIDLEMVLNNSDGKPVRLGDYFNQGKPVVLMLVYFRCPMQCPLTLQRFNQRLRELDWTIGKEFNVVVVSFDPTESASDAAAQKATYLLNYDRTPADKISENWAWLTSNIPGQVQKLADQVGFQYRYLPASNEYAHPTVTFVLSQTGMLSRYLYGIDTPTRDLRLALLDAGEGKIGNTIDKIMLFCFHFDPNSGSYSLTAFRVMQVASGGMVLGVGGLIATMLLVEHRRRRTKHPATADRPLTSAAPPTNTPPPSVAGAAG